MTRPTTVIFADDHPLVVKGFRALFSATQDLELLRTCDNGSQALSAIKELRPCVAVLDTGMPLLSGLDVLKEVNRLGLTSKIIFLSGVPQAHHIIDALAGGAYGYLAKDCDPDDLLKAVRSAVENRKTYPFELFSRTHSGQLGDQRTISIDEILTPGEWKVMALAAQGLSNKEIAAGLKITAGTVKIHLHHIFRKIGVANRTALASLSFRSNDDDTYPPRNDLNAS